MAKKSRQRKSQGSLQQVTQAGKPVSTTAASHKPWQIAAVCLALAVITIFVYRGSRNNEFVTYDDNSYVNENPQVQMGVNIESVKWAFTSYYASNWHPLTWISHMIDWDLYGKNASGHHMTNVYLHAANSVLLFLVLLYLTGCLGRSALVAFLFALHPAHVESVAWVSERKDVLCALFWFATLLAYAWYARRPSWMRYVLVACGFACAVMSKPMAVTLPFTLLLLDYWPLRRITFSPEARAQWLSSFWKLCVEKLPLFAVAAISGVLTFFAQRAGGLVVELHDLPFWIRICNAAISYWRYVRIMLWPNPLTAYYYHETNNISVSAVALSAIAIITVTAVCCRFREKRPYCLFGWLWFLGTLLPVIGVVQVGDQALAERYTYIPFIGLFIAIVWLAADAVATSPKIRVAAQLLAVVVIAACAVKTEAQVKVWKNSITLFSNVLEIDPRGGPPNMGLGLAYERQNDTVDALRYFEQAIVYYPSWPMALSSSAFCLMRNGLDAHDKHNLPLAGQRLKKALSISPNDAKTLSDMALWTSLMGMPQDEETYSRKALSVNPDLMQARFYLTEALTAQGKLDEAASENRQILLRDPGNFEMHNNLGAIYQRKGLAQEALKQYQFSLSINPNQAADYSNMGRLLAQGHQFPEAIEEFNQALRLVPGSPFAHNDLGVVYFQMKDYRKAAEQFGEAARIDPGFADARKNADLAQAQLKSK